MNLKDFKVGNKVIITKSSYAHVKNEKGKVIELLTTANGAEWIGIEFNFYHYLFHSCDDKGKDGYCYYIPMSISEKIEIIKDQLEFNF